MNTFVDTSAFVAYFNRDDQHHVIAARVMQALAQEESLLVTTNYTMLETTSLLQRRLGLAAFRIFRRRLSPS